MICFNLCSLVRNVAFVGHSHSGKSALIEWMLYDEQMLKKTPVSGLSTLDFDPVEESRHSSIFSHFARVPHRNCLLEISDTPWGDFPSDAYATLDGADTAVIVISASDGVQHGTINAFQRCRDAGIKIILCLSKLDRPFINIEAVLADIEESLGIQVTPLQESIGEGENLKEIKSLFSIDDDGSVQVNKDESLASLKSELEDTIAMSNDDFLIEYLENSELSPEKIISGLKSGIEEEKIFPLVYTSAEKNIGVEELMDTITAFLPNPVELREHVLKATCENFIDQCSVEPGVESGFAGRVVHT